MGVFFCIVWRLADYDHIFYNTLAGEAQMSCTEIG